MNNSNTMSLIPDKNPSIGLRKSKSAGFWPETDREKPSLAVSRIYGGLLELTRALLLLNKEIEMQGFGKVFDSPGTTKAGPIHPNPVTGRNLSRYRGAFNGGPCVQTKESLIP